MIEVGYIGKADEIQVNLEFINKYLADWLPELFLLCKLRLFSAKKGGKFAEYSFSKNERYNVLPNLKKLGWVDIKNSKVVKYRNILLNSNVKSKASFSIDKISLQNLKLFKAIVLATNEKYMLDCKSFIDSRNELMKVKKIKEGGVTTIRGRVFNKELSNIMGVSVATISRWRAESLDQGINEYELVSTKINRSNLGGSNMNSVYSSRIDRGSYFIDAKDGVSKITKDLVVTSNIQLFYAKSRHVKRNDNSFLKRAA